jgi:signal transduction histidine kinase
MSLMPKQIRILYLEDRPEDMELVKDLLEREYFPCELIWVNSREGYLSALRESWSYELILADYLLPGVDGDETLDLARIHAPNLPFIFLSGSLGEERAVECLRRGATDYVFKNNLPRLLPVLRRALEEGRQATARREAEAAHARTAALLRATLESTAEGLLVVDLAGRVSVYNRKFLSLFGIPEYVMASMDLDAVVQYLAGQFEDPKGLLDEVRLLRSRSEKEATGILTLNGGRSLEQSSRPQRVGSETVGRVLSIREAPVAPPDALEAGFVQGFKGQGEAVLAGRVVPWFLVQDRLLIPESGLAILGAAELPRNLTELVALIHPEDINVLTEALERPRSLSFKLRICRRDGSWRWTRWNLDRGPEGYLGVFMDITEQERNRERFGQRRWTEGARDMAGRLTERLDGLVAPALADLRALDPTPSQASRVDAALDRLEAAGQALAQLSVYAQLGRPGRVATPPNAFLEGLLAAARAEAGPEIAIAFQPEPDLPPVPMDPAQMALALMALLRNARQAMAGSGTIRLTSGLLQPRSHRPGAMPGPETSRVWFEVRDPGAGIAPAVAERIFEPLFSTRPASGGYGLGLALVRAIVEGHRGSIQVESAPDRGTSVRILLPV